MSWRPQEEKPKETCPICAHAAHRPGRCLALGIARRCMCEPGMTKDSLDAATMERDRGQAPQWF